MKDGHTAGVEADGERTLVARLIAVALVVRLATVAVAIVGLVGEELTAQALGAALLLAASSFIGLLGGRFLAAVTAHPSLAMLDVLLVLGVLIVLGVGSPLVLASFSTALLIGVVFPIPLASLLAVCLTCGYILALEPAPSSSIDGDSFFLVVGIPMTYACLVGIGHAFRRIAANQAATERALRAAVEEAAAADERARLARELHDSFAKTLQGIALGSKALASWTDRDPAEAAAQALTLADATERALQEARELLTKLRRDQLEEPFATVVERTCRQWSERCSLPCRVEVSLQHDPSPLVGYQLLTAMCEALDNAARHADAQAVEVTLTEEDEYMVVVVRDDGRGFDMAHALLQEHDGHFGLRGMRERMVEVGGRIAIDSSPRCGTLVRLEAPLGREARHARRR